VLTDGLDSAGLELLDWLLGFRGGPLELGVALGTELMGGRVLGPSPENITLRALTESSGDLDSAGSVLIGLGGGDVVKADAVLGAGATEDGMDVPPGGPPANACD